MAGIRGNDGVLPHRFNEINVIHIECVCPNLSALEDREGIRARKSYHVIYRSFSA